MKLTFILSQARSGELKALSPKDKTDEVVISYINLAMLSLYTRFFIKTEEAILALQDGKTLYRLDPSDPDVRVKGEPMVEGDVITVINAFDEAGELLPINDVNNTPLGIYTASYDTVQVPYSATGAFLSLIYQQNPTMLIGESICDSKGVLLPEAINTSVEIPSQLLEPLLHYIGYRAHGSVEGSINDENNTHYMRYIASCTRIDKAGTMSLENMPSRDVEVKGFI